MDDKRIEENKRKWAKLGVISILMILVLGSFGTLFYFFSGNFVKFPETIAPLNDDLDNSTNWSSKTQCTGCYFDGKDGFCNGNTVISKENLEIITNMSKENVGQIAYYCDGDKSFGFIPLENMTDSTNSSDV